MISKNRTKLLRILRSNKNISESFLNTVLQDHSMSSSIKRRVYLYSKHDKRLSVEKLIEDLKDTNKDITTYQDGGFKNDKDLEDLEDFKLKIEILLDYLEPCIICLQNSFCTIKTLENVIKNLNETIDSYNSYVCKWAKWKSEKTGEQAGGFLLGFQKSKNRVHPESLCENIEDKLNRMYKIGEAIFSNETHIKDILSSIQKPPTLNWELKNIHIWFKTCFHPFVKMNAPETVIYQGLDKVLKEEVEEVKERRNGSKPRVIVPEQYKNYQTLTVNNESTEGEDVIKMKFSKHPFNRVYIETIIELEQNYDASDSDDEERKHVEIYIKEVVYKDGNCNVNEYDDEDGFSYPVWFEYKQKIYIYPRPNKTTLSDFLKDMYSGLSLYSNASVILKNLLLKQPYDPYRLYYKDNSDLTIQQKPVHFVQGMRGLCWLAAILNTLNFRYNPKNENTFLKTEYRSLYEYAWKTQSLLEFIKYYNYFEHGFWFFKVLAFFHPNPVDMGGYGIHILIDLLDNEQDEMLFISDPTSNKKNMLPLITFRNHMVCIHDNLIYDSNRIFALDIKKYFEIDKKRIKDDEEMILYIKQKKKFDYSELHKHLYQVRGAGFWVVYFKFTDFIKKFD